MGSTRIVDIEDEAGNVIGSLDLDTMRACAPHPELSRVIDAGGSIYTRHENGLRCPVSPDIPKKRKARA
jgi:hypothetical protein